MCTYHSARHQCKWASCSCIRPVSARRTNPLLFLAHPASQRHWLISHPTIPYTQYRVASRMILVYPIFRERPSLGIAFFPCACAAKADLLNPGERTASLTIDHLLVGAIASFSAESKDCYYYYFFTLDKALLSLAHSKKEARLLYSTRKKNQKRQKPR